MAFQWQRLFTGSRIAAVACIGTVAQGFTTEPCAAASDDNWQSEGVPRQSYRTPVHDLVPLFNAEPLPEVAASPDRRWLLLTHKEGAPGIDSLRPPSLAVGEYRVDPTSGNWSSDPQRPTIRLVLVRTADGRSWDLPIPSPRIGSPLWSPDSRRFLLRHAVGSGVELWVGEAATRTLRSLTRPTLQGLASAGVPCAWMPDNRRVLCQEIPSNRGARPPAEEEAKGPVITESDGVESRTLLHNSTLRNARDDALYEYYVTAQPLLIDVENAQMRRIGRAAIYDFLSPSPDGRYVLAAAVSRPYSRDHLSHEFPRKFLLMNADGEVLKELHSRPLGRWGNLLHGWAPPGLRRLSWKPDEPATLTCIEALDQGDPGQSAEHRDRLLRWPAPFAGEPQELFRTSTRMAAFPEVVQFTTDRDFANIAWLQDGSAWVEERDSKTQRKRIWKVPADKPGVPHLLFDSSIHAADSDVWVPQLVNSHAGRIEAGPAVLLQHGPWVYVTGRAQSADGDRPFLLKVNTDTGEVRRIFIAQGVSFETVIDVISERQILTSRETPTEPPNLFLKDLVHGRTLAVTHFRAALSGITPSLLHYTRSDGVPLNARLYLPPGYRPGQRLPALIWAYPVTFADTAAAGRTRGSPYRFVWDLQQPLQLAVCSLAARGYVVLWQASMPILGGEHANDTAVEQMIANAAAAVDKLVSSGIADRSRIAIAGHSYGAAMATTLLANSDLFAAGIAISGAYNFTSTPVGFQSEGRTLWDAPQVYLSLSALMHADRIMAPLLLIHGEQDSGQATSVTESQRLYRSLANLGRRSRLVILPSEGHMPVARESVVHVAWELNSWLDQHLHPEDHQTRRAQSE